MICKRFFIVYINFRFCNIMIEFEFVYKIQNSLLISLVNGVYKKKINFVWLVFFLVNIEEYVYVYVNYYDIVRRLCI